MKNGEHNMEERNRQFEIMSALAMLYTVMGHTGVSVGTIDWFFPYDSFHMPLFVFISGYFFSTVGIEYGKTGAYIKKQIKRLLLPFFVWNFIYGIISIGAFSGGVIWCHGDEFWYRLIIRPFTYGNCFFEFNAPSWFILTLFEVKILNWFFRLFTKKWKIGEFGITLIYLAGAITAVTCSRSLERTAFLITVTRTLYMLFWFQVGTLYRMVLEKKDTSGNYVYLSIVFILQTILVLVCGEKGICAGIWNSEFTNNGVLTILCAATGIAFTLRISRMLVPSFGSSRLVHYISTHTFSIMMHQFLGFALLNLLFFMVCNVFSIGNFDLGAFQNDLWYRYLPGNLGCMRLLYVIAGFALPLTGCWIWERLRYKISKAR